MPQRCRQNGPNAINKESSNNQKVPKRSGIQIKATGMKQTIKSGH